MGAKSDGHTFLFDRVDASKAAQETTLADEQGTTHRFRHHNDVPLDDTHFDLEANLLEYWEEKPDGKTQHFSWVLMHLTMLAFLIDQIQQHCCGLFQCGVEKLGSKMRFWRKLRERFNSLLIPDWETLYLSIAFTVKDIPDDRQTAPWHPQP